MRDNECFVWCFQQQKKQTHSLTQWGIRGNTAAQNGYRRLCSEMGGNMEKLHVLLVDDEPLLLESLEIILSFNGIKIAGTAPDGNAALAVLAKEDCDLALVDLNMKGMGGIELIARMRQEYPHVKILVLTTFYDDKNITQAISGGADGYLLKDSGKDAILGAIDQIMGGRNVIDARVMQRLAVLVSQKTGQAKADLNPAGFEAASGKSTAFLPEDMTQREKEICTLLAKGLTNRQISETLFISEGTVKNYISSIYGKTGIHDRAKLVAEMNR